MEIPNSTMTLVERIQALEPANAVKVCGFFLLFHTPEEIMAYAVVDDQTLQSRIDNVKAILFSSFQPRSVAPRYRIHPPGHPQFVPSSRALSRPLSAPCFPVAAVPPIWDGHGPRRQAAVEFVELEEYFRREFLSNFAFQEIPAAAALSLGGGLGPMSLPANPCHYFRKGYCKKGRNCRFLHDRQLEPPALCSLGPAFAPGSLEELDREIAELLRDKKGFLVLTATLQQLYFERYGKLIRADGYLTESQRHGENEHYLTRLLSRLQSIHLIDKPNGQHAVALVEDEPRSIPRGASHIYLTFPPDSDFTNKDVSSYFSKFGPVDNVKIPIQDKRMFGFVSFAHHDTARYVLSINRHHMIKNSRVLVTPYKEKTTQDDRRISQIAEHHLPICHHPPYFSVDPETDPTTILYSEPRSLSEPQLATMEEHWKAAMELELQHLHQLQLATTNDPLMPHLVPFHMAGEQQLSEDNLAYPVEEQNLTLADDNEGFRNPAVLLLPDDPFADSQHFEQEP